MRNKKTFNHPWHSARQIATLLFILVLTATWNHTNAQTINVKGHITDSRGEPLPGVNILIKGTTIGTITNVDGNYEIKVPNPSGALLVFKFIGFADQEIPVNNQSRIDVTMEENIIGLDEVVAIIRVIDNNKKNKSRRCRTPFGRFADKKQ
jgi:hypothetical protein